MKLLSKKTINRLIKKKLKISIAESCTGGLLSSSLTSISGSSKVFAFSLVTYSNQSKINFLKIPKKLIVKYGSVSEQVCKAMVENVSKLGKTQISVSVTGIAGPAGGTRKKPVGLVFIGIKKYGKTNIKKYLLKNKGRSYIQKSTVLKSLRLILRSLK